MKAKINKILKAIGNYLQFQMGYILLPLTWVKFDKQKHALGAIWFGGTTSKVYIALLNQSGIDNPVPTVIDNSLPGTLTYTRISTGVYEISYSLGLLTPTICIIYFPKNSISNNVTFDNGNILLITPSSMTVILRPQDKLLYTKPYPNAPTYADNATALAAMGEGYYYKLPTGEFSVTYTAV